MTSPYAPPTPVAPPPAKPDKGRGLVIAGAVLLALSIVGGIAGLSVFGSRFSLEVFERDVAISGAGDRLVPGTLEFEVLEPLDEGDPSAMTVGIAVSDRSAVDTECTIEPVGGEPLGLAEPTSSDALIDIEQRYADWTLLNTVQLEPGDYEATCGSAGEPSASSGASFTVGRVLGVNDVEQFIAPALGVLAVVGVAGLAFLVGVVLLIVGLVQRSKAKQSPYPGPGGYGPGPYGPGGYGPGPYGPGGYGPGGYGPGGYGPGGYAPGGYPPGGEVPGAPPFGQPAPGPPPAAFPTPGPPPAATPPPVGPPQTPGPAPVHPSPSPAPPGATPSPGQDPSAPPPPPEGGSVGGWTVPPSKR